MTVHPFEQTPPLLHSQAPIPMRETVGVRGEGETVGFSFPAQFFAPLSFCTDSGTPKRVCYSSSKAQEEGATVGSLSESHGRKLRGNDRVHLLRCHSYPEGRVAVATRQLRNHRGRRSFRSCRIAAATFLIRLPTHFLGSWLCALCSSLHVPLTSGVSCATMGVSLIRK